MKTFGLLALVLLVGCSHPQGTQAVLEAKGYRDIQFHPRHWADCIGWRGPVVTRFTAVAPDGRLVSGVRCETMFFSRLEMD